MCQSYPFVTSQKGIHHVFADRSRGVQTKRGEPPLHETYSIGLKKFTGAGDPCGFLSDSSFRFSSQ